MGFPTTALILTGLAGSLASIAMAPSYADFYRLEGRFECLQKGGTGCVDMGQLESKPAPAPKPADPPRDAEAQKPAAPPSPPPAPVRPAVKAAPRDPVFDLASRVNAGHPSADDLKHLRQLARAGDARASELLGWCEYAGVGMPRDPVAAYVFYRLAVLQGRPQAAANQSVIFDYVLTSEERQSVAEIENEQAAPEPLP